MAMNPNMQRLREAGVSIWLDTLSRDLLESGAFAELMSDYGVTGATSNPTIFAKAITHSDRYDGQVAIASARVAYQRYRAKFAGPGWERLRDLGARPQRPLWASTGTKNPAYSDVLYVSELIGPDVVSTMPEQTMRAFADHGAFARTVDADPVGAERTLAPAAAGPQNRAALTSPLERGGGTSSISSFTQL